MILLYNLYWSCVIIIAMNDPFENDGPSVGVIFGGIVAVGIIMLFILYLIIRITHPPVEKVSPALINAPQPMEPLDQ